MYFFQSSYFSGSLYEPMSMATVSKRAKLIYALSRQDGTILSSSLGVMKHGLGFEEDLARSEMVSIIKDALKGQCLISLSLNECIRFKRP